MKRHAVLLAAAFAGTCLATLSSAQMVGETRRPDSSASLNTPMDAIRAEEFRRKRNLLGLTKAQLQARDEAAAAELVKQAHLSCEVTDAQLLMEGSETVEGRTVQTQTFEIACKDGLGYFLIGRATPGQPSGMSCFAAQATHDADLKAGRTPELACTLPGNQDMKAIAANVLAGRGKSCSVRDTRWVGMSPKSSTDYTEIACDGGSGFILASPLPGSSSGPVLVACHDAAMQGIPCKLSDNGQVLTLQTFVDALAQHHVDCDVSGERLIGREVKSQRHVVEFACKQHPEGLVAYIPLGGNTAPFETVDCATAAKRGMACKLTPAK